MEYVFKLDNPVFKQSNYIFDYKIYTDCYAVSIQMLYSNNVDSEKLKKFNKISNILYNESFIVQYISFNDIYWLN